MSPFSRRMFLIGGFTAFSYLYLERVSVAVRRYRVPVVDLPDTFQGFTILHLTDLHDKEFGTGGQDLLKRILRENFDIVAFTGDLVMGDAPSLTPALELINGIRQRGEQPIYCVSGNHDWHLQRGEEFNARLRQAGVHVLANSSAAVAKGEDVLWVIGVDDPVTRRDRLDVALDGTDDGSPRLLLSHSPHPHDQAVQHGIDLMLAGHTHGGQVRLPLLGACYVPYMGFFPSWDYGLYRSGRTTMIVSGGLGESILPIRVNIRPEISLITLHRFRDGQEGWDESTG